VGKDLWGWRYVTSLESYLIMINNFVPTKRISEICPDELFKKDDCELCRLESRTPQFSTRMYGYVLTICDTCKEKNPRGSVMLVCNFHEIEPEGREEAINYIISFFDCLGLKAIPRREMRKIKDHWHCHFEIK